MFEVKKHWYIWDVDQEQSIFDSKWVGEISDWLGIVIFYKSNGFLEKEIVRKDKQLKSFKNNGDFGRYYKELLPTLMNYQKYRNRKFKNITKSTLQKIRKDSPRTVVTVKGRFLITMEYE